GADVPFGSNGTFYYDSDTAPLDAATFFSLTSGPGLAQRDNTAIGLYAQDDWRVNDQLTLNLGVRYDVEIGTLSDIPFADEIDFLLRQHPNSPWAGVGALEDDKNNIAPRLGFVWDIGGRGITAVRGGYGLFYDQVILNTTLFNDLDVGDPPFRLISAENPPFGPDNRPSGDELAATYGFGLFNRSVSPDFKLPHTWQASVGVSHQFTDTLALDVDFIHSEASDLSKMSNPNERRFDVDGDGKKDNESRRFWPDRKGRLRILIPEGQDEYNGLQMSLRKRMANNVQFVVNYTLGDLEGNAQGLYDAHEDFDTIGNDKDIGALPNDVRHRFVVGTIFRLPYDFMINALIQAESARPVGRGADSAQDLNDNGDGGTSGHNVDWAPGPNGEAPGRGNFRGEPVYTFDLRVVKVIPTGGDTNIQVMAELFNIFNRVNWGPNFGNRPEAGNFGLTTGELFTDQFQAQLGIRFTF
ncbi:MAG: TonB-dependent receptor domain-containing protein, partial [Acidobacteriota bacterium]